MSHANLTVNTKKAVNFIIQAMKAKLPVMIEGDPGIGKSAIVYAIADQFKLELIDIRLSQCDPVDLNGFPSIQKEADGSDLATYVPMDIFPLDYTPLPAGKDGFLIFLDEFNSASLAVQAASYKLVLDKTVGQHKLHDKALIVCAGNLSTNNAIVNRLSTAMQSRLIHLELATDPELWIDWAGKNNIDHRIMAYVHGKPDNLHKFDPKHNDKTFACPRTWEFVSKLISNVATLDLFAMMPLIAGTISSGVANEFIAYTEIYSKMPNINDILQDPVKAKLNQDPAFKYGVSHMIAAYAKKKNLDILMKYVDRLPLEFQTITLQGILRRDESMLQENAITQWITVNSAELF